MATLKLFSSAHKEVQVGSKYMNRQNPNFNFFLFNFLLFFYFNCFRVCHFSCGAYVLTVICALQMFTDADDDDGKL